MASHFFFPHPYDQITKVVVFPPIKYPWFIKIRGGNYFRVWRTYVEQLAPLRINSLVTQDEKSRQRALLFHFEGLQDALIFKRKVHDVFHSSLIKIHDGSKKL